MKLTINPLCCLVLLGVVLHARGQSADLAKVFNFTGVTTTVEQVIKQIESALNPLKVVPSDLPALRPPPNTDDGWSFCDYSCATSYSVKAGNLGSTGVLSLEVSFKPLANVTSTSFMWLMGNLQNQAVYYRDNKTYPMYQLLHGVDHCTKHDARPTTPVRTGTRFTWCEIPLTGCQYNQDSATEPWKCPKTRQGFVSSDNGSKWANLFQTKLTGQYSMVVTWFNSSGIEFLNTIALLPPPVMVTRTMAATRLTWQDSPDGLLFKARTLIGLMKDRSNEEFDASPLAPFYNSFIKDSYLGAATNVPPGNLTAAGYMGVLHFLHEYGNTPLWLPEVYQYAMDNAAAQAAADAAAAAAAAAGRAAAAAARQAALDARRQQQAAARAQREAERAASRQAILAARSNLANTN